MLVIAADLLAPRAEKIPVPEASDALAMALEIFVAMSEYMDELAKHDDDTSVACSIVVDEPIDKKPPFEVTACCWSETTMQFWTAVEEILLMVLEMAFTTDVL